jgi:uncharacterized membrane protein HdeD (DUF308 family)
MNLQTVLPRAVSAKSIVYGGLLILLGLAALAAPLVASVSVTIVLAWVLMFVGLTHAFSSLQAETPLSAARRVAVGLVYFVVGFLIVRNPLWGVTGLTVAVGAVLLVESVIDLTAYLYDEDRTTSTLLTAIVTLVLGLTIFNQLPFSSLWAVGTLVGVNLLIAGTAEMFATGVRPRTVRPD